MVHLFVILLQLLIPIAFFGLLYVVVNKAVLNALRTDRAERLRMMQPHEK